MIAKNLNITPQLDGIKISFITDDKTAVDNLLNITGKTALEVKIEPRKYKRSLNANSYMWVLCDKIAEKLHTTKEDVYRMAVREVGVFNDVAISDKALSQLLDTWTSRGIGWLADTFDSKLKGCKRVRLYIGSHLYDTKQMARLVDYIVEEAKELGIETMTPNEIKIMLEEVNGTSF